jgi:KDO2-lipid IV(A) lauroyltransferase
MMTRVGLPCHLRLSAMTANYNPLPLNGFLRYFLTVSICYNNKMKHAKKFRFRCEYLGVKVFVFIISLMPWNLAVKFGEGLGILISKITHKRFNRTMQDIQKAFPEKSSEEARKICLESWKNIGRMAAEFVKAAGMKEKELMKHIEFRNFETLLKYNNNEEKRGAILHMGHFVNWEILGLVSGYMFKRMCFVARPQSNPYVDAEINRMRTLSGAVMINSYNPFFSCFKMLKKGYLIAILSDQSAYTKAAFYMPFMGRPAEVAPMSAVLALKIQVPVFPIMAHRENGKIIIEAQAPIQPPSAEYTPHAAFDLTRKLMDKYEEWLRSYPDSWLWGHNRWKRERNAFKKMQEQNLSGCSDA